jgi:hypothetical protein
VTINTTAIVDAIASHAAASGHFERVNNHEALSPPGSGLSASVWVQQMRPWAQRSGLAATSARLVLMVRIYSSALQEPPDAIDPAVTAAADALFVAYSGDFQLGGQVAEVDLLGAGGEALTAIAGWLPWADGSRWRVMDITLPVVINDAWSQSA